MDDRPAGSEVKTTYRGHIVLNAVPGEGNTVTPPAGAGTSRLSRDLRPLARRAC